MIFKVLCASKKEQNYFTEPIWITQTESTLIFESNFFIHAERVRLKIIAQSNNVICMLVIQRFLSAY